MSRVTFGSDEEIENHLSQRQYTYRSYDDVADDMEELYYSMSKLDREPYAEDFFRTLKAFRTLGDREFVDRDPIVTYDETYYDDSDYKTRALITVGQSPF